MTTHMPTASFEVLEATVTLRQIGQQVFLELEGDCWSANVTLTDDSLTGVNDWLTLHRMNTEEGTA